MTEESFDFDNWEERASDFSDEEPEELKEPIKEPEELREPITHLDEKSTKNMEQQEIDEMFGSMADVFRINNKDLGLPDNFSLETDSDYSILGEFIAKILEKNGNKTNIYNFFRSLIDNSIKNLDDKSLAEYKTSFVVEMNERTKRKKGKPKKKKAGIRMDNSNYNSSRYNDIETFADF